MKFGTVVILAVFFFISIEAKKREPKEAEEEDDYLDYLALYENEIRNKWIETTTMAQSSKQIRFGDVRNGVLKYECYARLLSEIATEYREDEILEQIAEELRETFWGWRKCQDLACEKTQWSDAEEHFEAFFHLINKQNALQTFRRKMRQKC